MSDLARRHAVLVAEAKRRKRSWSAFRNLPEPDNGAQEIIEHRVLLFSHGTNAGALRSAAEEISDLTLVTAFAGRSPIDYLASGEYHALCFDSDYKALEAILSNLREDVRFVDFPVIAVLSRHENPQIIEDWGASVTAQADAIPELLRQLPTLIDERQLRHELRHALSAHMPTSSTTFPELEFFRLHLSTAIADLKAGDPTVSSLSLLVTSCRQSMIEDLLLTLTRGEDLPARIAPERYAVLLPGGDEAAADALAKRLDAVLTATEHGSSERRSQGLYQTRTMAVGATQSADDLIKELGIDLSHT